MKYEELGSLNLPEVDKEILKFWEDNNIFDKSISTRSAEQPFVFFEGPPSANGMPGIHHVMGRTIKDLFCRYKTMQGFQVNRKGGWDTHGLPVELGVEKKLGITKEDIGKKISIEDYNKECRADVLKFKGVWDDITTKMGYWVDLDNPYVTFENDYIESLWALLRKLYDKGLIYKGHTVQPYSPAAGTGLSSHELNLPGCYKDVKDTTCVAQFKVKGAENDYFIAWTTTPWTLPSNCALGVGSKIDYVKVKTYNQYTGNPVNLILAKPLLSKWFKEENNTWTEEYTAGDKNLPWEIIEEYKGADLEGIEYEQLLPWHTPTGGAAFRVILGDFVTTEDGTGIVHLAPAFGADDRRVCQQNGIGELLLVNKEGKFIDGCGDFSGRYVKNFKDQSDYKSVDVDIAIQLKTNNQAFRVEKYEHSYPHCWRTDKPILYYPLESWFIKTTAVKDRLVELNNQINWKPESTGTGRFGNWLENLVDWNLSRSRFWGTPLPIWRTEDGSEEICIGSIEELKAEVTKAKAAGFMSADIDNNSLDLHRPYVDGIFLVSPSGKKMTRETDLIDVWFDSGAMPYAQWHYPFENHEVFEQNHPADFIAEGVDQTRGWFFTLHAISGMLFDKPAFKNVIANGLVLDKHGNKMSKRLGNGIDPFETIDAFGADATRWYMISNSEPWSNLKFDTEGIKEVTRKFFGTLHNTYNFFALYANVDGFTYQEDTIPVANRPEIDKWIISLLNTLIKEVEDAFEAYEPTRAARAIQDFTMDHLSNWYVRLCRRRFWKGTFGEDKIAAYQTLYTCLDTITRLMAPVAPMYAEKMFRSLDGITKTHKLESVHLADFPKSDNAVIDSALEERMKMAQDISSMVLALRKKENIKVRQPLAKIMIPVLDKSYEDQIEKVKSLILGELNIKDIEYVYDSTGIIKKSIKPNFKLLGKKLGKNMKACSQALAAFNQDDISTIEKDGKYTLDLNGEAFGLLLEEVDIASEDIEGWLVASKAALTVALDITITTALEEEGLARELVNRVQNIRKESNFDVTDRINLTVEKTAWIESAIKHHENYICSEILAENLFIEERINNPILTDVNDQEVKLLVNKV
jgi:isoleucyl-tRNA synthetase